MVDTFGATVEGVVALVPTLDDGGMTDERRTAVERHIEDVAEIVEARIGDLTGETPATIVFLSGKGRAAVHLGAAAYTVDALYQSGGSRVGSGEYGSVLWDRFQAFLTLLADAAKDAGVGNPVDPTTGLPEAANLGMPSGRFPAATFRSSPAVGWPYR